MSILLDFLFPRFCYSCGRPGAYLCPSCCLHLSPRPLSPSPPPFEGFLSLFPYTPPLTYAIKSLKFHFVTDSVSSLASLALSTLTSNYPNLVAYWQKHSFVICPVPLHSRRLLWRGFNQSQLLSSSLAPALHLDHQPEILTRIRPSPPQSTLASDSSIRTANVQNSFVVTGPSPSNVILFDDVSTTGSTLIAAARAFPSLTRLWGLVLASKS